MNFLETITVIPDAAVAEFQKVFPVKIEKKQVFDKQTEI